MLTQKLTLNQWDDLAAQLHREVTELLCRPWEGDERYWACEEAIAAKRELQSAITDYIRRAKKFEP